jgi:hypothetical protein
VDSEGWFATGDIGYMDEGGRLHLVDRLLTEEGDEGSERGMLIGQQIHHQFNMVDLCKIEQRLAGAVQEVAQIFVSGRTTETHAEVGIGLLGHLVGFVVVHRPAFLRWIADFYPPHDVLVARHTDLYRHHPSPSAHSYHDEEWEIVEDELRLTSASPEEDHKPSLPRQASASPSHSDRECQIELDKICQDPQVIKLFLNYLTHRAKSIGLKSSVPSFLPPPSSSSSFPSSQSFNFFSKRETFETNSQESVVDLVSILLGGGRNSVIMCVFMGMMMDRYEIPKTIHLSPNPFTPTLPTPNHHHHHRATEKGKSVIIDSLQDQQLPPAQSGLKLSYFLSLNSKNSQLTAHFSTRL